jgi:RNA polymerase sigma-70 factor (ECF subfamily)
MENPMHKIGIEEIWQAQKGDHQSVSHLTAHARHKVFVYIFRLTLDEDLSEDLAQETIVQLLRALKRIKLPNKQSFWAWLYRTALGNVQHHFRNRGNKHMYCESNTDIDQLVQYADQTTCAPLRQLVRQETVGNLMDAFAGLKMEHRNVLTLRCLDGLPYGRIAAIMGGSELRVRLLFLRARQSLKHKLTRRGFDKNYLLSALTVFGVLSTCQSKTACAAPSVTAAQLSITPGIAALGLATSKLGLIAASVVVVAALVLSGVAKGPEQQGIRIRGQQQGTPIWQQYPPSPFNFMNRDFSPPASLQNVEDPGRNEWKACNNRNPNQPLITVNAMRRLWGTYSLILPPGHVLEMIFSNPILDGPGPDIFVTSLPAEADPKIYVTDGARQVYLLKNGQRYASVINGIPVAQIPFDLSGLQLPFQPKCVRIVGPSITARHGGYELASVNARIGRRGSESAEFYQRR